MAFKICGLIYNDNPKSRVEKLLIDLINSGGGGGGESDKEIGRGLVIRNGAINVNTTSSIGEGNSNPASSNGMYVQLGKVDAVLDRI